MTRLPLTARQQELLDYLIARALTGSMPSLREMGEHMGIRSTNGVNDHLHALERKGRIERDGLKSRSILVVGIWPEADVAGVPARVYTFEDKDTALDWWDEVAAGPEFNSHAVEQDGPGLSIVVTRSKR